MAVSVFELFNIGIEAPRRTPSLYRELEPQVSSNKVIKTNRKTGADMKNHYRETSRGDLAVNVIEC